MKAFYSIAVVIAVALAYADAKAASKVQPPSSSHIAVFTGRNGVRGVPLNVTTEICRGKVDENVYHPTDCTKYVSCSNEIPYEMPCGDCNQHLPHTCLRGKLVFSLDCTPDAPECQDKYGLCVDADKTECRAGQEPEPTEGPTEGPGPIETTTADDDGDDSGEECDPEECKNHGTCQHYFRCDKDTRKLVREECGQDLVWNPRGNGSIHGGNCDIWDNLDQDIEDEYRSDKKCLKCFWEENGKCNALYKYQAPGLKNINHQTLSCARGLVFSEAKETCQRCEDEVDEDGNACC